MIHHNEALLQSVRDERRCGWCRCAGPVDPHHVFGRGFGGGSRLDLAITLVPLCRLCHTNLHAGALTQDHMLAIVAERTGVMSHNVRAAVWFLRRLDKAADRADVEAAIAREDYTSGDVDAIWRCWAEIEARS